MKLTVRSTRDTSNGFDDRSAVQATAIGFILQIAHVARLLISHSIPKFRKR
jgi:hypothetical protein